MTYEEIVKANETLKTTDIKGKDYTEVNQRIKAFRMVEVGGAIISEIVKLENGFCVMKTTILDNNGKILATGHAYEKEDSSFINKTSYIENCETSAVGRALGMCGFGIDTSVASYEEVKNAIENQKPKTELEKAQKTLLPLKDGGFIELDKLNALQLRKILLSEDEQAEKFKPAIEIILKHRAEDD